MNCYIQINDKNNLFIYLKESLDNCDEDGAFVGMNLVLFDDAIIYIYMSHSPWPWEGKVK